MDRDGTRCSSWTSPIATGFRSRPRGGRLREVDLKDDSGGIRWSYGIGVRQEARGRRLPLLAFERVTKDDQVVLRRRRARVYAVFRQFLLRGGRAARANVTITAITRTDS